MKLFIAVPIESETDYEYLANCSDNLKRNTTGGSFVRFANFHVTLIYIGETERLLAIEEIMDGVLTGYAPFDFVIDRTGTFSQGKSTTVWVGGSSGRLLDICEALWSALEESEFEIEKRKYKPHITIARRVVFASKAQGGGHQSGGHPTGSHQDGSHPTGKYQGGSHQGNGHRSNDKGWSRKSHTEARALALDNPPHVLPVRRIVLYSSEVIDSKRVYRELHSVELEGTG